MDILIAIVLALMGVLFLAVIGVVSVAIILYAGKILSFVRRTISEAKA